MSETFSFSAHLLRGPGEGPYVVPERFYAALVDAYPEMDTQAQMKRLVAWLEADPRRCKTRVGMPKFLNGCFARAQDSGSYPRKGVAAAPPKAPATVSADRQQMKDIATRVLSEKRGGTASIAAVLECLATGTAPNATLDGLRRNLAEGKSVPVPGRPGVSLLMQGNTLWISGPTGSIAISDPSTAQRYLRGVLDTAPRDEKDVPAPSC
jgi:hypothetical protein